MKSEIYKELLDIKDYIYNGNLLLAHIPNKNNTNQQNEIIQEHSSLCVDYYQYLCKTKKIDRCIKNCIEQLIANNSNNSIKYNKKVKKFILKMLINAIWLHDIGKINPKYQKMKMKNILLDYKDMRVSDSHHSLLSALLYIQIFSEIIENGFEEEWQKNILLNILYKFAYVISRHHSQLNCLNDFIDDLKAIQDEIKDVYSKPTKKGLIEYFIHKNKVINIDLEEHRKIISYEEDLHIDAIVMFVITRLLYSTLTSCDFYATTEYMSGLKADCNVIKRIDNIIHRFQQQTVTKAIMDYKHGKLMLDDNNINKYRSDMFIESEDNLLLNLGKSLFYLEAPTGAGKTNTSINLALQVLKECKDVNKFFYISPFNVVAEQTHSILHNIFGDLLNPTMVNSTSSVDLLEKNNDYTKLYSDRQHLHYPCILTSHIKFFQWVKGVTRDDMFPLIQLCNSVVILDEIQSYKNSIWTEIIMLLSKYAELLNIKIIIMSATLPKLSKLIENEVAINNDVCVDLIKNKWYYYNSSVFKSRVKIDFSMLEIKYPTLNDLADNIIDKINNTEVTNKKTGDKLKKKVLIEFIKKDTANDFYEIMKTKLNEKIAIEKITNDEKGLLRQKILDKFKKYEEIIIVTTQVIEAGADIDAHIGFKDISVIDSEEQFMGRINRNFLKYGCKVFFFNWDNLNHYKGDFRKDISLLNKEYRNYIIDKDFNTYYEKVFAKITEYKNKMGSKSNIKQFKQYIKDLDYKTINDYITLIDSENTYQIFLNYDIQLNENVIIKGSDIWNKIKELKENADKDKYCQNQIELVNTYSQMNYFTYTCYCSKEQDKPYHSDDNIGNLYYIENGKKYIYEDGKLNRKLLEEQIIYCDSLLVG